MTHLTTIFMYGTLMRGQQRHGVVSGCNYLGVAYSVSSRFVLYKYEYGCFPVLMQKSGDDGLRVQGELYEVDDDVMHQLDCIEARGLMYDLHPILVQDCSGYEIEALSYMGITDFWEKEEKHLKLADVVDGCYKFNR